MRGLVFGLLLALPFWAVVWVVIACVMNPSGAVWYLAIAGLFVSVLISVLLHLQPRRTTRRRG